MRWLLAAASGVLFAAGGGTAAEPAGGTRPAASFDLSAFGSGYRGYSGEFLKFSPDGNYLTCGWMLFHVPSGRNWGSFDVKGPRHAGRPWASFSPDSKVVVVNSTPMTAWRLPTAEAAKNVPSPSGPEELLRNASKVLTGLSFKGETADGDALAYLPGGDQVVTVKRNMVHLRELATGEVLAEADVGFDYGHPIPVLGGKAVVVWHRHNVDLPLALWDLKGVRAEPLPGSAKRNGYSLGAAVSPDGGTLVEAVMYTQSSPGELRVWDLATRQMRAIPFTVPPCSVAYLPKGDGVVVGMCGGGVEVYDVRTGRRTHVINPVLNARAEGLNVLGVAVSPSGEHVAAYTANELALFSKTLRPFGLDDESAYFPTEQGTTWVYRRVDGTTHCKVVATGVTVVGNERTVTLATYNQTGQSGKIREFSANPIELNRYTVDVNGIRLVWGKNFFNSTPMESEYRPGVVRLAFPVRAGAKWDVNSKVPCSDELFAHKEIGSFKARADTVTVPAGRYEAVVAETARYVEEKDGRAVKVGARQYWFAKNVGLVKWYAGQDDQYELAELVPATRAGGAGCPLLQANTVWAGVTAGSTPQNGAYQFPARLYVTERVRDAFRGEYHFDAPDGVGKMTVEGRVDGDTIYWLAKWKSGNTYNAILATVKCDGKTLGGTWKRPEKEKPEGQLTLQLAK